MQKTMSYVNFNRQRNQAFATGVSADPNTVYFTTDTKQIIIGGLEYGGVSDYVSQDQYSKDTQIFSDTLTEINNKFSLYVSQENYLNDTQVVSAALNDLNSRLLGITDDLNFLPLTGGTLTGDLFIGEGSTALLGTSQGKVTLYNDTHLDFNGKSGTTTMGLTENGFIISNDGELKLSGDSIVINSADSLYFSGSSDATFTTLVHVDNEVHAQAFFQTSDARKKDIKSDLSLDKCYDLIDKCQTVIYSLKDQTKEQVGMIAQEIEEFFPEVVATDEEGFKSLAYDRLVVICFKVLKDVIKRLEKLENNGSN